MDTGERVREGWVGEDRQSTALMDENQSLALKHHKRYLIDVMEDPLNLESCCTYLSAVFFLNQKGALWNPNHLNHLSTGLEQALLEKRREVAMHS